MRFARLSALAGAIVCAAAVLTACGGSSGPASRTATPSPDADGSTPWIDECALATPVDFATIIQGQPFSTPVVSGDFCTYKSPTVTVTIGTQEFVSAKASLTSLQNSASSTTAVAVNNVGNVAYWETKNNQLAAVVGPLALVVDVFSATAGDQANANAAAAIAKVAISRLP